MLYMKRTFTLPVSSADGTMCREKGHSATDSRGRCFCCGEKIRESIEETSTRLADSRHQTNQRFIAKR